MKQQRTITRYFTTRHFGTRGCLLVKCQSLGCDPRLSEYISHSKNHIPVNLNEVTVFASRSPVVVVRAANLRSNEGDHRCQICRRSFSVLLFYAVSCTFLSIFPRTSSFKRNACYTRACSEHIDKLTNSLRRTARLSSVHSSDQTSDGYFMEKHV